MVGTLGIVMAISNNGLVSYQQKSVLGCVICAILGSVVIVIVASVSGDDMCELLSLPSLQLTLLSVSFCDFKYQSSFVVLLLVVIRVMLQYNYYGGCSSSISDRNTVAKSCCYRSGWHCGNLLFSMFKWHIPS